MFLGGAALGVLTMSVALWRSPFVPRIAPAFLITFLVLDIAGWPVVSHVLGLVGGAVLAWAVVTGYSRRARAARTMIEP
jgi:membrane associated rhomboid family serine protease